MKIIHTMGCIDNEAAGPSYSVIRLSESLRTLGNKSSVALTSSQPADRPYIHAFPRSAFPERLTRSPQMHQWLKQQVASRAVDIIHNHSLWVMPNVYPGWATKSSRIPYVVSPRGTLSQWAMASGSKIKHVFWPLLQRPSIAHAALFHATAESEYVEIRRLGFKQPIAIIPNGIDIPEYIQKPIRLQRTLLYLGRIHPKKGIDFLLHAWSALGVEFPEWNLVIAGPDNIGCLLEMKLLSEKLNLSRVSFPGPLYGAQKIEAYRNADLFVLPTHSENFGLTVAEALACGTPCVVSQGAPWKGLESNQSGWWPSIGTEPILAALRVAMSKPQTELDAMGENGRQWMQNDYAWDHIGDNMQKVYAWLLKLGAKPDCVQL